MQLLTVGHSTLSADAFVALLLSHHVTRIADVRTLPRSRRHPHFASDALRERLAADGIGYRHLPGLGGLRRPRADSTNTAWVEAGFRGFADHMGSDAFEAALGELLLFGSDAPTAVMCAEAKWWQCHRRLIADALVARGAAVGHILGPDRAVSHELTPFAVLDGPRLSYPGLI